MGAAKLEIVRGLEEQLRQVRLAGRAGEAELVSSGCAALDALLPGGCFRRGTLVEWLAAVPGSGAMGPALSTAREACREGGTLVVIDRRRQFYPPAALAWGISLEQMVVVRPKNAAEEAWACDQALRCRGAGAVLCWPEKLDDRTYRRWQLAAESSGVLGLLLRPATVRKQPAWAEMSLLVTPQPGGDGCERRLRTELVRTRGARGGGVVELMVRKRTTGNDHHAETHALHLVAALALATPGGRASGT